MIGSPVALGSDVIGKFMILGSEIKISSSMALGSETYLAVPRA